LEPIFRVDIHVL